MLRKISVSLIAAALLLPETLLADTAFGCPEPGKFTLGEATLSDITAAYPYDFRTATATFNDVVVDVVTYTQTSIRKKLAVEKKVTPARALSFIFHEDKLVGYEYVSSFKEDHTDFDDTKVRLFKKGETSIDEVEEMIGRSCGVHVPPMVADSAVEARVYGYSQVKGSFKLTPYIKNLIVGFDADGIVQDIKLTVNGER